MNKLILSASLALISHNLSLHAVTITATQFNQLYSCANPFRPTETSTIILDTNIIFNDPTGCEPIIPGVGFNIATDVVNFRATNGNSVQIAQSTAWFIPLNITFQGNAQLITFPGAQLILRDNNPTLCMSEQSIFKPVS